MIISSPRCRKFSDNQYGGSLSDSKLSQPSEAATRFILISCRGTGLTQGCILCKLPWLQSPQKLLVRMDTLTSIQSRIAISLRGNPLGLTSHQAANVLKQHSLFSTPNTESPGQAAIIDAATNLLQSDQVNHSLIYTSAVALLAVLMCISS